MNSEVTFFVLDRSRLRRCNRSLTVLKTRLSRGHKIAVHTIAEAAERVRRETLVGAE